MNRLRSALPVLSLMLLSLLLTACASQPASRSAPTEPAITPETTRDTGNSRHPLDGAGQLVVVTAPNWDASQAEMHLFERRGAGWQESGDGTAVSLGRNGIAWGLGLHPMPQPGPQKQEGDGRSPAGVFVLPGAFGYGPTGHSLMPYEAMDDTDWCIDVPTSPFYNQIIDARHQGEAAVAGSSEPMRLDLHNDGDVRYALGLKVGHNLYAVPGKGSCIFMHLWRTPGEATAGCTAMSDSAMLTLLAWLDPQRSPVLVLLPEAEYTRLRDAWHLPALQVLR